MNVGIEFLNLFASIFLESEERNGLERFLVPYHTIRQFYLPQDWKHFKTLDGGNSLIIKVQNGTWNFVRVERKTSEANYKNKMNFQTKNYEQRKRKLRLT